MENIIKINKNHMSSWRFLTFLHMSIFTSFCFISIELHGSQINVWSSKSKVLEYFLRH